VFPFFTVLFGYDVIGALGNELCMKHLLVERSIGSNM
jgi:hypothetical protein